MCFIVKFTENYLKHVRNTDESAIAYKFLLAIGVFIVAAKRTPFGAYGGLLKDFTATDMAEFAARAALSAGKVSPETVDSVVVGNVIQVSRAEGKYSLLLLSFISF